MNKCEADELEQQDNELLQVHAAPLRADLLIHRFSALIPTRVFILKIIKMRKFCCCSL